ncbi:MAG: gliding motility protein GldL, partial [Bacteroidota bacterium]
ALFKLMHWEGADVALIAGLGTEAFIFFMYAFAPVEVPQTEPDWSKISQGLSTGPKKDEQLTAKLAAIEASIANNISEDNVKSFGTGMKQLASSVNNMKDLAEASVATSTYAKNVSLAANSLVEMNKSYSSTMSAMSAMADASKDAKAYHTQVQSLTKTLSSLNAAYEMELQDSKKYITALNKYYGGLSTAMENVVNASKDAEQFKAQLAGLTTNITALNKVYGAMLTAMKGAQS